MDTSHHRTNAMLSAPLQTAIIMMETVQPTLLGNQNAFTIYAALSVSPFFSFDFA